MNYTLYGYNLNGHVEYRISTGILVNIRNGKSYRLNNTSRKVLEYCLSDKSHHWISDNEIALNVFDKHGLRYSSSALWRVMKALKMSFENINSNANFIRRHHGHGYYVDHCLCEVLLIKNHPYNIEMDDKGEHRI